MTVCCPSKSLFLPLVLLLGAGALALGASSFRGAIQDAKPAADKPRAGAPALHDEMEAMNAALKALKRELAAKDANAWRTISQFQRGVANAKLDQPKTIQELPEGERAAALQTFRTMMADLLQASCKLEHEVLAGKWDEAAKTLEEVIKPMKKRGHDKFNVDD